MKKTLLFFLLLFSFSLDGLCQYNLRWDWPTTEAFIYNHKNIRKWLTVREVAEAANKEYHEALGDTTKSYRTFAGYLDKYDRYLDFITLLINGLGTAKNIIDTYNFVSDRVSGMHSDLERFRQSCLSEASLHGLSNIHTSDSMIIVIFRDLFNELKDESDEVRLLYVRITASFGTGSTLGILRISTKNLILILQDLNEILDDLRAIVNRAYQRLTVYIGARLSPFFSSRLYLSRSLGVVATDALNRWLQNKTDGSVIVVRNP